MIEDEYRPLVQRLSRPGDRFLAAIDRALAPRAVERPQSVAKWRAEMKAVPLSELPLGRNEADLREAQAARDSAFMRDVRAGVIADDCVVETADENMEAMYRADAAIEAMYAEDGQGCAADHAERDYQQDYLDADPTPEGLGPGEDENGRW